MPYKIEKMSLKDFEAIHDILESEFDNFWTPHVLKEELLSQTSHYFVAKNEGEIIGFAGIKVILDEADIMNIVVKKSMRRHGIGSLLLKKLIEYCKCLNVSTLSLEVNSSNISAISLYKKFGFEALGSRKNYYNGNDGIIMSKKIELKY